MLFTRAIPLLAFLVLITLAPRAFAYHSPLRICSAPAKKLYFEISYRLDKRRQPIRLTAVQAEAEAARHLPESVTQRVPKALAVYPANFFHTETYWPGGLLVIPRMNVYQRPSKYPNRPVLAQRHTGEILFLTNQKAWAIRSELRIALEAGPFLIVGGQDWNDFSDLADDPHFLDPTERRMIGARRNGEILFIEGFGGLRETRQNVRRRYPDIHTLVNLDGGSSAASQHKRLPTRLIAYYLTEDPPTPTPVPMPNPSPTN